VFCLHADCKCWKSLTQARIVKIPEVARPLSQVGFTGGMARRDLDERFLGDRLDREVWFPYYLPHWSSRSESAATHAVLDGELRLSIPVDQPLWCPDLHDKPIRVSCVQTGSWSGPRGSAFGQQPFREGLLVREEQPEFWGYTPLFGDFEITMRGTVTPRSMFAFWMSGIEDRPERSGEICVAEIFGASVEEGSAGIGIGIHRFRDPNLKEDFSVVRMEIDVAEFHTYAIGWEPGSVEFAIDGTRVLGSPQAPDYPMQLMLGVFDFPGDSRPGDPVEVPEMIVTRIQGGDSPPSLL
jgi:Glycosyl hydrolases family 16